MPRRNISRWRPTGTYADLEGFLHQQTVFGERMLAVRKCAENLLPILDSAPLSLSPFSGTSLDQDLRRSLESLPLPSGLYYRGPCDLEGGLPLHFTDQL